MSWTCYCSECRPDQYFSGDAPEVGMPLDVRRADVTMVPAEVVAELCTWCGVDRVGGCGACSDLKSH